MYEKDTTIFEKNDKRKTWDLFENTKRKNDEDSVDLEDPFKPYPIFNKNSSPILQQKKRIKQSNSDNDFKLFDLTASSKNKPQITKEELEKQILWRKEFMTSWIKMYKK
ncbi:uncharacterized protein BX663DRAFT_33603 [Cokeromyces recurvatus]|uniref:uncharacterized protein n=1 Tax=Cokeromyces recurvatus TaxID=90255 RepID=UPI00221F32CD|nr:uncharacterized protein BX663DRAFT_33603 [Cokeromyces recurvatus]KAI7903547.1 hypothetical protein BX663DRAFT_33603 [Cokeromyces recurvatus]